MLKRRRRIRKIINAVKRKQLKKGGADLLKYKLEEQDDVISERLMGGVSLTKHDVE